MGRKNAKEPKKPFFPEDTRPEPPKFIPPPHNRQKATRKSTAHVEELLDTINLPLRVPKDKFNPYRFHPQAFAQNRGRANTTPYKPTPLSVSSGVDASSPPRRNSSPPLPMYEYDGLPADVLSACGPAIAERKARMADPDYVPPVPGPVVRLPQWHTVIDEDQFIVVVDYQGEEIRIFNCISAHHHHTWLTTIRTGPSPVFVKRPMTYMERPNSYYVDKPTNKLVITWLLEEKPWEKKIAAASQSKAQPLRSNFGEAGEKEDSSSSSSNSEDGDGWHPFRREEEKPEGSARDFNYMSDAEWLADFKAKQKAKETGHNLTKDEKDLLKKSVKLNSTKELASAAKGMREMQKIAVKSLLEGGEKEVPAQSSKKGKEKEVEPPVISEKAKGKQKVPITQEPECIEPLSEKAKGKQRAPLDEEEDAVDAPVPQLSSTDYLAVIVTQDECASEIDEAEVLMMAMAISSPVGPIEGASGTGDSSKKEKKATKEKKPKKEIRFDIGILETHREKILGETRSRSDSLEPLLASPTSGASSRRPSTSDSSINPSRVNDDGEEDFSLQSLLNDPREFDLFDLNQSGFFDIDPDDFYAPNYQPPRPPVLLKPESSKELRKKADNAKKDGRGGKTGVLRKLSRSVSGLFGEEKEKEKGV